MEINQFKALQVRIESAVFESSDFWYYITVELDHTGERVSKV
jgi:phosphoribosyl-ATP pyrophosphohydrolase